MNRNKVVNISFGNDEENYFQSSSQRAFRTFSSDENIPSPQREHNKKRSNDSSIVFDLGLKENESIYYRKNDSNNQEEADDFPKGSNAQHARLYNKQKAATSQITFGSHNEFEDDSYKKNRGSPLVVPDTFVAGSPRKLESQYNIITCQDVQLEQKQLKSSKGYFTRSRNMDEEKSVNIITNQPF